MRDHHQCFRAAERAFQRHLQILRIKRGEAFVQNDELGVLQQRACNKHAAAFAMR